MMLFVQYQVFGEKHNPLTEKLSNWYQQQRSYFNQQLDQQLDRKQSLERSVKQTEEQLNLLTAANSSIKTKLPLLKKLEAYKVEMTNIDSQIQSHKNNLKGVSFTDFSESQDFERWMKSLEGLTTAQKMELEKEVQAAGQLQGTLKDLESQLSAEGLSWDALMQAENWEQLWLETDSEKAQAIQAKLEKLLVLQAKVQNINLNAVMEGAEMEKIAAIADQKFKLPVSTQNIASQYTNGFDLEKSLEAIQAEKAQKLASTAKKYRVKEIEKEDYKEVIIQKKPELKEMMFMEADISLLRSDQMLVNASSVLGMQLSKKFALGLGTSYQNMDGLNTHLEGNWSGRLMTRMNVWKDILAVQVEGLSSLPNLSNETSQWNFSQLIGTRFSMPSESKVPMNFTLMHNLNSEVASPAYAAPWFMKLGIQF